MERVWRGFAKEFSGKEVRYDDFVDVKDNPAGNAMARQGGPSAPTVHTAGERKAQNAATGSSMPISPTNQRSEPTLAGAGAPGAGGVGGVGGQGANKNNNCNVSQSSTRLMLRDGDPQQQSMYNIGLQKLLDESGVEKSFLLKKPVSEARILELKKKNISFRRQQAALMEKEKDREDQLVQIWEFELAKKREKIAHERQQRFLHFPRRKPRRQKTFDGTFLTAVPNSYAAGGLSSESRQNSIAQMNGMSSSSSLGGGTARASIIGSAKPGYVSPALGSQSPHLPGGVTTSPYGKPGRDSVSDFKLPPVGADMIKKPKEAKKKGAGNKFGTHTIIEEARESSMTIPDTQRTTSMRRKKKLHPKSKALSVDPKTKLPDAFYGLAGSAEGRLIKERGKKASKTADQCDPRESLMPHKMLVRKAQVQLMNKLSNQLSHYRHQIKAHFKKIIEAVEVQYTDNRKKNAHPLNLAYISSK